MTVTMQADRDTVAELRQLDRSEITTIVRRVLENDHVEVTAWDVHPLGYDYTSPISAGIHRITGTAHEGTRRLSWSLIHKAVRSAAGVEMPNGEVVPRDLPDDPSFFGYWEREPLAYQAGLLADLPGCLIAPRCYGVGPRPDGIVWLWLQEVASEQRSRWTPERCEHAARVLGRFNGTYLSGRPLPAQPYLGRGWLRSWLTARIALLLEEIGRDDAWRPVLVRRTFPRPARHHVLRMWTEREVLLDGLDRLPLTFCHRDAFRSNLFVLREEDGREQVIAIDWAYAGIGPVGEEIAPLIAAAPAGEGPELAPWNVDSSVFDGYSHGLAEAGWHGDSRLVRFGYAASAALRYLFLTVGEMLADARDERNYAVIEQRRGRSIEHVMQQHASLIEYLLGLSEEARALLPRIATRAGMEAQSMA